MARGLAQDGAGIIFHTFKFSPGVLQSLSGLPGPWAKFGGPARSWLPVLITLSPKGSSQPREVVQFWGLWTMIFSSIISSGKNPLGSGEFELTSRTPGLGSGEVAVHLGVGSYPGQVHPSATCPCPLPAGSGQCCLLGSSPGSQTLAL